MSSSRALRRACVAAALALLGTTACFVAPSTSQVSAATCDNVPLADPAPTVRVLVIGDSLSQEFAGDFTWRYRFWQYERALGVNIDFVGPYRVQMPMWNTTQTGSEDYADPCFNQREHLAIGGKAMAATLKQVSQLCPDGNLYAGTEVAWATYCYQPDVVLDFMGYNDLKATASNGLGHSSQQVLDTVQSFLGEVHDAKPGTPVAVVNVASSLTTPVVVNANDYNSKLAIKVPTWSTATDPVGLVDITKDWKAAPADTWDGYHPNANGEMHLAWDISTGLHGLIANVVDLATKYAQIPAQPLGPRTPGTVAVTSGTTSSVNLRVTFPLGADTENLYQQDVTAGTGWQKVGTFLRTYTDSRTGLPPHLFQFRVQAAKGTATATDVFSPTINADLRPIGSTGTLTVVPARHAATLTWSSASTADRYIVRLRRAGSGWKARSAVGTSYRVSGLVAGARYEYQVVPVRGNIHGPQSAVVTRTAQGTVNPAVPRPTVSSVSNHRLRISWQRAPDATRYQVKIRPAGGAWRTLGWTTATHATSRTLVRGRNYAVAVVAWDSYVAGRTSAAAVLRVR